MNIETNDLLACEFDIFEQAVRKETTKLPDSERDLVLSVLHAASVSPKPSSYVLPVDYETAVILKSESGIIRVRIDEAVDIFMGLLPIMKRLGKFPDDIR